MPDWCHPRRRCGHCPECLTAEIARLRALLAPFARYGRACLLPCCAHIPDASPMLYVPQFELGPTLPTIGECRAVAREVSR